jgi:transposase InsO family protein
VSATARRNGLSASQLFTWRRLARAGRLIEVESKDHERVLPFFEEHDVKLLRVLTDRGSEFCGNPERHEYELYLAVEDIDHSRTKTKSPQTNGICERFHKTALNEFYRVAFRKKVYRSIDELQPDLDAWIREYNETRPHQGRWCFGKTPTRTFLDAMPMAKEKMIAA